MFRKIFSFEAKHFLKRRVGRPKKNNECFQSLESVVKRKEKSIEVGNFILENAADK